MRTLKILPVLTLALAVLAMQKTFAADAPVALRKIAIIVQNRAGADLNGKVSALEDLVASRVAGKGFAVISRDDVTRSLKNYADANGGLSAMDRSLEDGTSALRLAQNLGADFILVPSIVSHGTEKKDYVGNGISTLNILHKLRVTYKIVEAGQGGAVRGGAFTSEAIVRQTAELQTDSTTALDDLLDDAADQLAAAIVDSTKGLALVAEKPAMVSFKVACMINDRDGEPVNDGKKNQLNNVTVELDGVALGSAPGTFQAYPGMHKIRVQRDGFKPWEQTVSIYDQQTLNVALTMTDAAISKQTWGQFFKNFVFRNSTLAVVLGVLIVLVVFTMFVFRQFWNRKNERILVEAEAEKIRGEAQRLRQSGEKVDIKADIASDFKKDIKFVKESKSDDSGKKI